MVKPGRGILRSVVARLCAKGGASMEDREEVRRNLERKVLELVTEYQRAFRDHAEFEEQVSELVRAAVEESAKLRRAFEHGERSLHEAAKETG